MNQLFQWENQLWLLEVNLAGRKSDKTQLTSKSSINRIKRMLMQHSNRIQIHQTPRQQIHGKVLCFIIPWYANHMAVTFLTFSLLITQKVLHSRPNKFWTIQKLPLFSVWGKIWQVCLSELSFDLLKVKLNCKTTYNQSGLNETL